MFITDVISPTAILVKRFKAPRGMLYEIFDVHFSIMSAGNNAIGLLTYLMEDDRSTFSITDSNALAIMSTDIAGQSVDYNFTKGEKTKFFTLAGLTTTAFQAVFTVHFELVKASRTELLIEWFRKGR